MCNFFGDPATVRHKVEVLREHCQSVGRDPSTIVKTRLGALLIRKTKAEAEAILNQIAQRPGVNAEWLRAYFIAGGPDEVSRQAQAYLDAGLDGMIFNMPHIEDPEAIELGGRTLSQRLEPAGAR
jgi:alkanesulfonate monooxygenase SsuD/methylene tetrahydromethanopterin reductase-like flavin-dependent oxidoreductase (luciferase family)